MKKHSIIISILVITNLLFMFAALSYTKKGNNKVLSIYTVSGENEDIKITDGLIIITKNQHILIGGTIHYIEKKPRYVKFNQESFYIYEKNNKHVILTNATSLQGDLANNIKSNVLEEKSSLGESRSENLFTENQLENIQDNLYFTLKYEKLYGSKMESTVKLNVNKLEDPL